MGTCFYLIWCIKSYSRIQPNPDVALMEYSRVVGEGTKAAGWEAAAQAGSWYDQLQCAISAYEKGGQWEKALKLLDDTHQRRIKNHFKNDGRTCMRAYLRKNANQKCQLYVKLVAKRPSCWYRTNLFYSTFSNEGYPFRRPRMISNVNISDRKLHWPHSLPFLNTHEKN